MDARELDRKIAALEAPFAVATPQGTVVDWSKMRDASKVMFDNYMMLREMARLERKCAQGTAA